MSASYGNQVKDSRGRSLNFCAGRRKVQSWGDHHEGTISSWSKTTGKVVLLRPQADTRDEDPTRDFLREARSALLNLRASVASTRSRAGLADQLAAIASAWEDLDACGRVLESQAVILCAKIGGRDGTARAQRPEWVEALMTELESEPEQGDRAHPIAAQTASSMLASLEQSFTDKGKALEQCVVVEVDSARNGAVEVVLSSDIACVQWKVRPSELPWPLVDVLAVERFGVGHSARREVRSYRLAQSAVSAGFSILTRTK